MAASSKVGMHQPARIEDRKLHMPAPGLLLAGVQDQSGYNRAASTWASSTRNRLLKTGPGALHLRAGVAKLLAGPVRYEHDDLQHISKATRGPQRLLEPL